MIALSVNRVAQGFIKCVQTNGYVYVRNRKVVDAIIQLEPDFVCYYNRLDSNYTVALKTIDIDSLKEDDDIYVRKN